ncbi:MAG: hypothetical protein QGG31_04000 [Anaerolineales bacterium]|jgi:Pyruvate/2-oxoacid:ferredoxin oxidoreductase gamma subunit|nr:hypothetical protein [Anaerolineales bacterium]
MKLTHIASEDAIWQAIEARVPPKTIDINRRAFERGIELVP